MPVEIGGTGVLGIAFETTAGTFVAPTKWIPIRSESLQLMEDKQYRMNIRGIADRTPGARGNVHVEGDIEFEVTRENLIYFLYAMRTAPVKTGVGPDFTYTFSPTHTSLATTGAGPSTRKTLSVLVRRGGQGFGYSGLSVGQLTITFDAGTMVATVSVFGMNESDQATPAQTWPTVLPFGPTDNEVQIPAASARSDLSTATLTINDNGVAEHRLDGQRFAAFTRWGEREVTFSTEHDFDTKADYNTFLNQTIQQLSIVGEIAPANNRIEFLLRGTIADSYQVNLSSLGDLVAASVAYHATHDAADAYQITLNTTEVIA